jgi:hypothetical protein
MAVFPTPLIVAFIPGQSPPELRIPIFMFMFFFDQSDTKEIKKGKQGFIKPIFF